MNEENFEKIIKDQIRPLKENLEVVTQKVKNMEFDLHFASSNIKAVKDQQSVINEKIDTLTSRVDSNSASLMEIESTIKAYGEADSVHEEKITSLKKSVTKIETHLDLPLSQQSN